jgi:hypothetical protein
VHGRSLSCAGPRAVAAAAGPIFVNASTLEPHVLREYYAVFRISRMPEPEAMVRRAPGIGRWRRGVETRRVIAAAPVALRPTLAATFRMDRHPVPRRPFSAARPRPHPSAGAGSTTRPQPPLFHTLGAGGRARGGHQTPVGTGPSGPPPPAAAAGGPAGGRSASRACSHARRHRPQTRHLKPPRGGSRGRRLPRRRPSRPRARRRTSKFAPDERACRRTRRRDSPCAADAGRTAPHGE